MRVVSSLWLSLALVPMCVAQKPVTPPYKNLPDITLYSDGYFLGWDSPQYTQFTLYDRDAKPAFSAPERTGDSALVMWAVDSDGVVAAAYRHRAEGRIDLLNVTGSLTSTISTGTYIPQQVVFASDHTIWTVGYDATYDGARDFNVLHHYARTGEELGQALPWSQTGGDRNHPAIESIRGSQLLYIANDRVGWNEALHPGARTWTEVSFSGAILGKYDLKTADGLSLWPLAMTASGNVYAKIFKSQSARFAVLYRSRGIWQKVVGDPAGMLIGSEGNNLVFFCRDGAGTTLKFTPLDSLRVEEPPQ